MKIKQAKSRGLTKKKKKKRSTSSWPCSCQKGGICKTGLKAHESEVASWELKKMTTSRRGWMGFHGTGKEVAVFVGGCPGFWELVWQRSIVGYVLLTWPSQIGNRFAMVATLC